MMHMEFTKLLNENIDTNVKIYINANLCISCGICEEVCPFGLPARNSKNKYEISQPELCTECSACSRNCPVQAIFLEEAKGCGCLWNIKGRNKSKLEGNNECGDNCCG